MSIQKGFWKSAGFAGALGTLAQGAAQMYGSMTGNIIDAGEVKEVVEQATTVVVSAASIAGAVISVYQGGRAVFGKIKQLFRSTPLPWLAKDSPTPPKE